MSSSGHIKTDQWQTHGQFSGSCWGAGTEGSCPRSPQAGPAERRPCRLCTETGTSRRVRPSAPATTRKPERDGDMRQNTIRGKESKILTGSCFSLGDRHRSTDSSSTFCFNMQTRLYFMSETTASAVSEDANKLHLFTLKWRFYHQKLDLPYTGVFLIHLIKTP